MQHNITQYNDTTYKQQRQQLWEWYYDKMDRNRVNESDDDDAVDDDHDDSDLFLNSF